MRALLSVPFAAVGCVALILSLATSAQGLDLPPPSQPVGAGVSYSSPPDGEGPPAGTDISASPAVTLGQPGTSFRYLQTFGVSGVPYTSDDITHLNAPGGLGTDGTNVWIAESSGMRALKFQGDGAFLMKIGTAGQRVATPGGPPLGNLADVGVDGAGNVWLVSYWNTVFKYHADGSYAAMYGTGNPGQGNDEFGNPQSIAFDTSGNIYISDRANHRVQVFDSSMSYIRTIGVTDASGTDNDHFSQPGHIAIDGNNRLYVADTANNRVQIFDVSNVAVSAPTYLDTLGVAGPPGNDNGHFNWPEGVGVDGSRIYVADSHNNRVQVFDRTTLAYLATIGVTGQAGQENDKMGFPIDVVVDSAGNVYVSDQGMHRVQKFTSALVYSKTFGTTAVPYLTDDFHYAEPSGVAWARDDSIYVVEAQGQRLLKLNSSGSPLWVVGQPGFGWGDNEHFGGPRDVAIAPNGRVYVTDSGNNRVQIFDQGGGYMGTLGAGWGTGDLQFNGPTGVAIGAEGKIYVADTNNHRVQIYDSTHLIVGHLGVTGVPGSDNAHFNQPEDVAVDNAGNIYVADRNNQRVQIFNSDLALIGTIGETGVRGSDFDHLQDPSAVAVDQAGRVYVAESGNNRVLVFAGDGNFLTSIGGSYGVLSGQLANPSGLAVGKGGTLYIADRGNHRIQKLGEGVPNWRQLNVDGFGHPGATMTGALASFDGRLYAGSMSHSGPGGQIWRRGDDGSWSVVADRFGDGANRGITGLIEFKSKAYAGTYNWDYSTDNSHGGQVWRSAVGMTSPEQVVTSGFGDSTNSQTGPFVVFDGVLYAIASGSTLHGMEIWRSDTGDSGSWSRVVSNGFGDGNNIGGGFAAHDGHLYVGTRNNVTGGEVWRSATGAYGTWTQVNADGFGTSAIRSAGSLATFGGNLYAGTAGSPDGLIWRCHACDGGDWAKVIADGFGNPDNGGPAQLGVFEDRLYVAVGNSRTGVEVVYTADGAAWRHLASGGFGDSNNQNGMGAVGLVALGDGVYVGTTNSANGTEVWQLDLPRVFLPYVVRK